MRNSLYRILVLLTLFGASPGSGQQHLPYHTDFGIHAPIIGVLLVGMVVGLNGIQKKDGLTGGKALALRREDVNQFDQFITGLMAANARATFIMAKVFNNFHLNSQARSYLWASVAPITVGYLRLRTAQYFLSDNLLGYAVGAGAGILVPHLHKVNRSGKGFSLLPVQGFTPNGYSYSGFSLTQKL